CFLDVAIYCSKLPFSLTALLNLVTVSLRESLVLPPEALKWPPPLKYVRAKVLQSNAPLLLKLHFLSSSRSITNPTSFIPCTERGRFTNPSVSPVFISKRNISCFGIAINAVLYS